MEDVRTDILGKEGLIGKTLCAHNLLHGVLYRVRLAPMQPLAFSHSLTRTPHYALLADTATAAGGGGGGFGVQ